MNDNYPANTQRAIHSFRSARQKAVLREIITRITGASNELLSFDEVRHKLKAQIGAKKTLKEISIKSIIGSVNRYQDFNRGFLPSRNIDPERWVNVELANNGLLGLPPIEAYQIGEVYFVSDGNHRVSVAKQLGSSYIQAYVTEVHARVPLTEDSLPEDLILKSEYATFLQNTKLDELRSDADLSVTEPGQYDVIEEHIGVHRYFMGIEQQREIPYQEAVVDWYDHVYMPVISLIRENQLLLDFPKRTEADLYLWIAEHRAALEEDLEGQVTVKNAIQDLAERFSQRKIRRDRYNVDFLSRILPDFLKSGPPPGYWRQSVLSARQNGKLFKEILVPINGHSDGWYALEQAMVIAQRERTGINGLLIITNASEYESYLTRTVKYEFYNKCESAGLLCDFQIRIGGVRSNICTLAEWNDLVVLNMTFPPGKKALTRLKSGVRNLIHQCPRPILFTPQKTSPLNHALLAYDGSLQSKEALYVAVRLVKQWEILLDVILLGGEKNVVKLEEEIQNYLISQNISTTNISTSRKNIQGIVECMQQKDIDFLITGGYKQNPLMEIISGSNLDELLRQTKVPTIICK